MEKELIEMAADKAKEKYRAYRDAVGEYANNQEKKINEGLKRAYRMMGQGRKLIDIEIAFGAAGMDEKARPNIALARASLETAFCHTNWDTVAIGSSEDAARHARQRTQALLTYHRISFPATWMGVGLEEYKAAKEQEWRATYSSPVPVIPIELRPKGGLSTYHILFEAKWQSIPNPDPLLLKHCTGTLFAVLAEWDMSEIELAVLKQATVTA